MNGRVGLADGQRTGLVEAGTVAKAEITWELGSETVIGVGTPGSHGYGYERMQ